MKTSLRARDFSEVIEGGPMAETKFYQVVGETPLKQITLSKEEIIKDHSAFQILKMS